VKWPFSIFAGEKPKTAFSVKVLFDGIGFAYITRRCDLMLPLKVWGSFQISSHLCKFLCDVYIETKNVYFPEHRAWNF